MSIADTLAVPDFRSASGLFRSLKSDHKLKASGKQLFDASVYQTNDSTSSFHDMVRNLSRIVTEAKPTVFHQMLSTLGSEGRLLRLFTQNVDGIDVALPSLETDVPLGSKGPWPRTVQLHGGLEKMVCSKCNHLSDFEPALFDGPEPPPCKVCMETDKVRTSHAGKRSHGIGRLRPRIVLYNEHNPDEEAIGAVVGADLRARPDAVIVVGTSMKIPGVRRIVREMCGVVRGRRDGLAVWINQDPPPVGKEFEDCWDLVVKGPCDEVARHWSEPSEGFTECTESEVERAKQKSGNVKVIIDTDESTTSAQSIPTPAASPHPKSSNVTKHSFSPLKPKVNRPPVARSKQPANPIGPKKSTTRLSKAAEKARPKRKYTRKAAKNMMVNTAVQSIDQKFKVCKVTQLNTEATKTTSKKNSENELVRSFAMAPISPGAARINGLGQAMPIGLFPHPSTPSKCSSSPDYPGKSSDTERWNRRRRETISPTGSIPKDMIKLLNE